VLAASGLFPIAGTDTYLVGNPRFTRMTLHLAAGDLVLDAPASDQDNIYVDAATLDDVALTSPRLHHADLAAGGLLRFDMTATPGSWGQDP